MLDDTNDLRDAVINQQLNPLRINVHLSSNVVATRTKQQAMESNSPSSTSLEDQLSLVKLAIDDTLKFVPDLVPSVLANISHDLRSSAASSLAELLDCIVNLLTRSSNMQPCCGSADGSQKSGNSKVKLETGSASEPSDVQISGVSEAGLKSGLSEVTSAKTEQVSSCPSVEDSLVFSSSGGMKSDLKQSANTETKIKSFVQFGHSEGKPISITSDAASTQQSVPVPSMGEKKLTCAPSPSYTSYGSNGAAANGNVQSLFLPHVVYPPSPVFPSYDPIFGANWKTTGDLHPTFPASPNVSSPRLNTPSSVGTFFPNVYSTGSSHGHMASMLSHYVPNPEGVNSFGSSYRSLGANYGNIPQHAQHRWIQCDVCGVTPIIGPRYKSVAKENYDLCGACFSHIDNKVEYTKIDRPTSTSNMKILGRTPAVKNNSQFIKDVTIPDGTPMAPSTPFTKIWCLRNNGSCMWPYGTQLVWDGGDHLTCLTSVRLAISGRLYPCEETDVTVDFLAPAKPGRYISYWRLALPSRLKFGQRIWVHIQVEPFVQTSGTKQAAQNLNQLPEASSSKPKPLSFDINNVPTEPFFGFGCSRNIHETMKPEETEPAPSDMFSAPAPTTGELVQIPVTEAPGPSADSALVPTPACLPAPAAIPLPNPAPIPPVCVPADTATVCVPAPAAAPISFLEEKPMSDLEGLGFMQADMNKQILKQNNYDLEQSAVDLCRFNEWDPCLEEFSELGSDDPEIDKEEVVSVVDNSDHEGFILTDLVTKGKKEQ